MKKLITIIGLLATVFAAEAQIPVSRNMLLGSLVYITNNTTVQFGYTNILFVGPTNNTGGVSPAIAGPFAGAGVGYPNAYWSQTTNAVVPTLITNSAGPGSGYVAYWTNFNNTYTTTNPAAGGAVSTAFQLYGNPWQDVGNFSDRNGNAAVTSFSASAVGTGVAATNTVTMTFSPILGNAGVGSAAGDQVVLVFSANGLTPVSVKTNIASTLWQGVTGWRLQSVKTSDCTNNQVILTSVNLNGFQPSGSPQ